MGIPKFKGINKATKQWTYGFGWYETNYTEEHLKELGQSKQYAVLYTEKQPVLCLIDSMGQYTSLKDINGVEIYEGDIVEFDFLMNAEMIQERLVRFKEVVRYEHSSYYVGDWRLSEVECEVVGNIHTQS